MSDTCKTSSSADSEDNCPICFDTLSSKRILILHPCKHRIHQTCIMNWFESREPFEKSQFTCCLCRTLLKSPCDEKGQLVMLTYPMEVKEDEIDEDGIRNRGSLVRLWRVISGSLDRLKEDKKNAKKSDKVDEFIADIDEEAAKLQDRQKATMRVFIRKTISVSVEVRKLFAERRLRQRLLASAFEAVRTRAQKRALEQERLDAEEAFEEEMDAVAEAARVEFKELCAAELAATAAKKAAAAAPARPTTRAATKRGTEANNEPSQQPKRRR